MEPGSTEGGRADAGNRILIETDGMEAVDWAYEEGKNRDFLKRKKKT